MVLICGLCGWRSAVLALGKTQDSAESHFKKWQANSELPAELDRALALNPRYSAAWIARGLAAEAAGNRRTAETSLLRAAEADRGYLPGWTLANFYLRSGNVSQFWTWARRAGEMAYEPTALFQLCWRVSSDPREILERAIPPTPRARRAYLDYLIRSDRFEAAEPVAGDLRRTPGVADLDTLLHYCDVALERNRAAPAAETWKALARARLIPYPEEAALNNGDLASAPLGHCFDWRRKSVAGAAVSVDPTSREMLVSLSGRQPESCDLIEQYVAVQPNTVYRLRFRYRTRDLTLENGLGWSFLDAAIALAPSENGWSEQQSDFSTPKGCDLARLTLRYRRPTGAVRAEGSIVFARFTLERAE
jgi:hypothetical protein